MTRDIKAIEDRDNDVDDLILEPLSNEALYTVTFNQNRSFELFIGRKMFFFTPYSSNLLTREEVEHSDFIQQSEYFSIKEI
jgi:hypothetical protein